MNRIEDDKGFFYKFNGGERKGVRYLTCYQKFCKGSASIRQNGSIVSGKDHSPNCLPNNADDERLNEKIKFRKMLMLRAKLETTRLKTIYDEECIRNRIGALQYAWAAAEISMRHERKKSIPVLPLTIYGLANYLESNPERYRCCDQSFYLDHTVDRHGKCSVIFGCAELLNEIITAGGNELHADATFKIVPSNPKSRQIFMMHLIIQNHSIPIVYALMESKTEEAYKILLEKCNILFPQLIPRLIMTDYEKALKNAFSHVYPQADMYSCWFHYIQSLMRNIKSKGLTVYIKNSEEAQMCIKMFAALALLPANLIEQGYQCIRQKARVNNLQLTPFFNYFNNFWLRTMGPEMFSVHGIARRTNNNIENFHGRLKEKFQVSHPNLWTFLKHLNDTSARSHISVKQLIRGQKISRPVKVRYIANSERIKVATAQLHLGVITVNDFLIQCSHTAETYIQQELQWSILVEQNNVDNDDITQTDDGNDESGAEEILPDENINHRVVNFDEITQTDDGNDESDAEEILPDENINHRVANRVVNFDYITRSDDGNNESDAEGIVLPVPEMYLVADDSNDSENVLISRPINHSVDVSTVQANWDEEDFIIQEERDPDIVNMMEMDNIRREMELQDIPFVQVSMNVPLPPTDNTCIVCKDFDKTHALIPCGHKSLCGNCVELLDPKRCPLCNADFNSAIRIW